MRQEFIQEYQKKIEEIGKLDISSDEKRTLAEKAKKEIMSKYRTSYIDEKEIESSNTQSTANSNNQQSEDFVNTILEQNSSKDQANEKDEDPINGILNKFEERELSGQVGVKPLEEPVPDSNGVFSPDDLFSTMSVDDLFGGMDLDDEEVEINDTSTSIVGENNLQQNEPSIISPKPQENPVSEFNLNSTPTNNDPINEFNLNQPVSTNQFQPQENNPFNLNQTPEPTVTFAKEPTVESVTPIVNSGEANAMVTEVNEGYIVDDQSMSDVNLDEKSLQELDQLEKERDKSQKLGIIEILLMLVLVVLVAVVLYILINQ